MPRPALGRTRVQITLPPDILESVSRLFGTSSRSATIELALRQLITRAERRRSLGEFPATVKGQESPTRLESGDTTFSGQGS